MDDAGIKKIADLARLAITDQDLPIYRTQLTNILQFIEHINQADTKSIIPMAHPVSASQRLRDDVITEGDERDTFQNIAPSVEAGFYLVPKVIE